MTNCTISLRLRQRKTSISKVPLPHPPVSDGNAILCLPPGEIGDLEKQLSQGGSSVHELEKAKRKLEQEKEELTQSLEDAEGQLEGEQQRVLRIQLELTQLKQETERKLAEKDGEMEGLR